MARTLRLPLLLAAALGGLLALVVYLLGRTSGAPPVLDASALDDVVAVTAPARVTAGDTVTVTARDASVLIATSSYGTWTVEPADGAFELPDDATRRTGLVTLTALSGAGRGTTTLVVEPRAPVDPVRPFVGARSIEVDGAHWAMVVAIPEDDLGNPMADGTPVGVRHLHPDGVLDEHAPRTLGGLAWQRLFSRELAGRGRVAVSTLGARGPETDLVEVPGPPATIILVAPTEPLVADGRQLVEIRTERLVDRFGNEVADGTAVAFLVDAGAGRTERRLEAVTVQGVATAVIEAPRTPSTLRVIAEAYRAVSDPLDLAFGVNVANDPEASWRLDGDTLVVAVGPVLGSLDQYVPDGTEVVIEVSDPTGDGRQVTGQLREGHAEVRVPWAPGRGVDSVRVSVGGRTVEAVGP